MVIFKSEEELLHVLSVHDKYVYECASGELGFNDFCEKYNNFYFYYALDGHESDEEEYELLVKHIERIELHEKIAFEILGRVCADEDAEKQNYIDAGRFGSVEAVNRLKSLVDG